MSILTFNIILLGNSSVGKSCLISKYAKNIFQDNYLSTIGVDFLSKEININNQKINLKILDTCGQERYKSIASNYYRKVDGIMFVFDVTNKTSFDEVKTWLIGVDSVNDNCQKILVGNKIDLENNRNINKENIEKKAKELNMKYYETSAKTGQNVEEAFTELVNLILNNKGNINNKNGKQGNKNIELDYKDNKKNIKLNCCKN